MTRFLPLLLAAGLLVSLTGCGQKGDLYLPDQDAKQTSQDDERKAK
jgi:predicted small lipoprotein YifL